MNTKTIYLATHDYDENSKIAFDDKNECISFCKDNPDWGWDDIQLHSSTVELNRVLLLLAKWLINNKMSVFKDSGIYHGSKELILRKLNYSTDMLQ